MKKFLKSSLSIVLALTVIFSSAVVGLNELDFSGLFTINAKAADTGVCGENAIWTFSGDTLTISGTGEITDNPCLGNWFYYDTKTIIIEEGITGIGDYVFGKIRNLSSISIPASVTQIGINAFNECYNLKSVYITDLAAWCNIDFENNKSNPLFCADALYLNGELLQGEVAIPSGVSVIPIYALGCHNITSVIIPYGVTEIGDSAFCYSENLTSVTIPDSVVTIGVSAFSHCYNLAEVIIPDSVTTIGKKAFYNCSSLKSITLSENLTAIAEETFSSCESLETITIPGSVKNIGISAFDYCTGLADINFCEGVESIDYCAFYNCTSLTSVVFPDSMQSIGTFAFESCRNLNSITIPDSVTHLSYSSFYDTAYYHDLKNIEKGYLYINNHLLYVNSENVGDCEIREGTKTIAGNALSYCRKITSIKIPDSVVSIGNSAFRNCTGIETITIPDSVVNIGYDAFRDCTGLEAITISEGVTTLGNNAFDGCTNLKEITLPDSLVDIDSSGFINTAYYNNEDNWENDLLYIGNHLIAAKNSIYGHCDIKDGTKIIAASAFGGCTKLFSVSIPDTVTNINECAFVGCLHLFSVEIPDSVTDIGICAVGFTTSYNYGYNGVKTDGFVVCGKPDTAAETYAKDNGFVFVDSAHTHISSDWKTIIQTTIDAPGVKIKECTICRTALEIEAISQLTPAAPEVKAENQEYWVFLDWNEVDGADEYIVYRREYNPKTKKWSGWSRLEDGVTRSCYYDGYAKSGTYYKYTVKASNEAGCSSYVSTDKIYYIKTPKLISLEHNYKTVTFKWEKVEGATGYIVYRRDMSDSWSGWKKVATTKGNTYVDKNAKTGVNYKYTVRAYYGSSRSYFDTAGLEITILTTPKLKSVSCSKNGATIKWNEVKGTHFYYVYRRDYDAKTKKWSGWTRVSDRVSSETYVDKTAKSGKYYIYTVKAIARAGTDYDVSGYDKTGLKLYFLATPSLKSATSTKSGVKLQWNKINGASGYKIYRKTGNNPWGEAIATVKGKSVVTYVDKTAKKGVTYTYTVRAYNGTTKSGYIPEGKTVKDKY